MADKKIKLAVVTGGHPFDVPGFRDMFGRMTQCDVYIQDLDNWAASKRAGTYDSYDVFLFYTMVYWGTLSIRKDMDQRITDAFAQLGESSQGICVLHHALLNFPDLPDGQVWSDVCNVPARRLRGFKGDEVATSVVTPDHPITRGVGDWQMTDEVFLIDEPGAGSQVLLTTDHPSSTKALAWAHQYKNARVFCYQSGHGVPAYTDTNFQKVLAQGIEWLAGRS